ncbi:MFS transporter [Nocardioides guangzhouensis]|uniref:MFS transporter n=2 Tax=Nocardioides guangzhouensis TaxID=2497878 RepID=A0A4Q4Z8T3_9ACTN|nr:MFS transporter [Nocardioides guangzhouensis]
MASFWHDLPREGKLLISVVVFEFIGTGLVLPFWVVYLHEVRGFGLDTVGVLLAVLPLAGMISSLAAGPAIDRLGPRAIQVLTLVLAISGQCVMAFAATLPLAVLGMTLTGASFGLGWPSWQSLVASVVPSAIRQRYFGLNFTLLNLGIGIGGVVGGIVVDVERTWTFQLMYLGDALSYALPLVVLLVPLRHVGGPVPSTHEEGTPSVGYLGVLRRPAMPLMVALSFVLAFVGYGQLNSGMPAFARSISEVSTRGLGWAFAANTVVIVLIQLVVLQRIEGRRRTRVVMVMAVVWGVAWLLLGLSGLVPGTAGATLLVAACASVFALGETLFQPTMPAMTNDLAPDDLRGRYNAITAGSFQLGSIVAPVVAGLFIDRNLGAGFIATLLLGLVVLVLMVRRLESQITPEVNGIRSADVEPAPKVPVPGVPEPASSAATATASPH